MSETAQTLIKAAFRAINVIATGETPTSAEMADGLEALKIMLRRWSGDNMMIYFIDQDTLTMDGSTYYTIGSGGDVDTTWPEAIKGAIVDSLYDLKMIDEAFYRRISRSTLSSPAAYLWYNPEYPLGLIYPFPVSGSEMILDTLKPLSEPSGLTSSIAFPPPYDAAIKWNLALELAPEFGQEPSGLVLKMAHDSEKAIKSKNFASQINAARLERVIPSNLYHKYDIDEG